MGAGAYKQQKIFLIVLEAGKSKIKVLADSVSAGNLLSGSETLHVSSHDKRAKGHSVVSLIKDTKPIHEGFPGGSVVKNPPANQETLVRSLGQEDPLE